MHKVLETEVNMEGIFKLPNPNLVSYFGSVERGQLLVYDTPFAKGESTDTLLSQWQSHLESIQHEWPTLFEFEMDLARKVGPMSVRKPLISRMDDVLSYYDGILLPSSPLNPMAIKAVVKEWSKVRGLHIRDNRKTMELMKKSTNSGAPLFKKRRLVVDQTLSTIVYPLAGTDLPGLVTQDETYMAAAILGWRGQEGGRGPGDVKQRVVWMFPFAVNLQELRVYQPLIEAAQKFNLVPAWIGETMVDDKITALFDSKDPNDLIVCTDFSKFDQHFNPMLQDAAYAILRDILAPNNRSLRWLESIFPIKYNIPIVLNWGTVMFGKHGMASGSGGTNADETLVHRALQYEAAMKNGAILNPNSQCLGDDGLLSYPGITVDQVVEAYTSHGLEMNPDKQYASTQDCIYLRRWHHVGYRVRGKCVGVYSTMRALGHLRYIERYHNPRVWNAKMVAIRQLSIIENAKYHPLFHEFIEFCMKRDKYRLGIDIPGFLAAVDEVAAEAMANIPDFLGYVRTLQSASLVASEWEVVKYLKSKV